MFDAPYLGIGVTSSGVCAFELETKKMSVLSIIPSSDSINTGTQSSDGLAVCLHFGSSQKGIKCLFSIDYVFHGVCFGIQSQPFGQNTRGSTPKSCRVLTKRKKLIGDN